MDYVTQFTCRLCLHDRHEVVTASRVCHACRAAIHDADKTAHLAKLSVQPLAERVRRLEEALYELDADKRLRALESASVRY